MGSPTYPRRTTSTCRVNVSHGSYSLIYRQGLNPTVARTPPPPQDPAAVIALKKMKDRFQSEIQRYRGTRANPRPQRPPHTSDFARLARRICGKSIGVVLGGGGARGISHLVCRAIFVPDAPTNVTIGRPSCSRRVRNPRRPRWRSVPVASRTAVRTHARAGTSIGALIGGLYAREGDIISSSGRAKQFSARMGNIWRMLSDVTYPIVAYTTVRAPPQDFGYVH